MVRVFHCDDSVAFRELIRAEFEDDPDVAIVGGAPDLPRTLAGVADARPDIVLLDLVDSGTGAVDAVKSVAPEVRVVVLSGHPREFGERRGGGAEAYVEKDAPLAQLRDALVRVAGG